MLSFTPFAPFALRRLLGQPSGWMRLLLMVLMALGVMAGALTAALLALAMAPLLILGKGSRHPLSHACGDEFPALIAPAPRERGM